MKTRSLILTILAAALSGCAATKPGVQLDPGVNRQPALLKPARNPVVQDSIPVARLHEPVKTMPVPPAPAAPMTGATSESGPDTMVREPVTVITRPEGTRVAVLEDTRADDKTGSQGAPGHDSTNVATAVVTPVTGNQQRVEQGVTVEPVSRVINGVDEARAAYVSGKQALGQGNIEQAIGLFTSARNLAPELVDAHTGLGVALSMAARHEEALPAFQQAVELEPTNAQWHANLGLAYARIGDFYQAQQSLAHAWSLKPGDARIESQLERVTAAARSAGQLPATPSAQQGGAPTESDSGSQLVQVRERVYNLKLNGTDQPEPVQPVVPIQADLPPSAQKVEEPPRRVLRFGVPAAATAANARAGETASAAARTAAGAANPVVSRATRAKTGSVEQRPASPVTKPASPGVTPVPAPAQPMPEQTPVSKPAAQAPVATPPVAVVPASRTTAVTPTPAAAPVSRQPFRKEPQVRAPAAKASSPLPARASIEGPVNSVKQSAEPSAASATAVDKPVTRVTAAGKPGGKTTVKSRLLRGLVVVAPEKGAAQRVADYLAGKGLRAGRVGRPSGVHALTEIHYRPGYERDVQDIRMALPVRTYSVVQTQMPRGVNVQVVVGRDLRKLSGLSVTDSATR